MHPSLTIDKITEAVEADDHVGFCIKCGAETQGVEPDARRYECEACGKNGVFGAQELLIHVIA